MEFIFETIDNPKFYEDLRKRTYSSYLLRRNKVKICTSPIYFIYKDLRPSGTGIILLVPELCNIVDLSEKAATDVRMMKDISVLTMFRLRNGTTLSQSS